MFVQKSMNLYSISSFSPHNFLIRCLNQLLVLAITLLFIRCKSMYCCMLFMLIIVFNLLNFKIRFEKKPDLKYLLNNQIDYRISCHSKEAIVFKSMFYMCLFFLFFKLSKILISPFVHILPEEYKPLMFILVDFHERLSFLIWESPKLYTNDAICQIILTFTTYFFYKINKGLKIYYDFYTVQIYKKIFNRFTKYFTLVIALILLTLKEIIYFNLNLLGFIENLVIMVMMIKLFLKFKVGNYKNLKKYVNVLRFIAIFKLMLFLVIIVLSKIFSSEIDSKLISFLTSEIDSFLHPESTRLVLLIMLYYLYNVTNFSMKFQNLFVSEESSHFFGTLQNKPYKLFFISYFAKNLLKILNVTDIKHAVRHNFELRYKFYNQLKKYTYFRKSFEYNLKSSNITEGVSRKYTIYEIWNKYLNIFDIYKYDILAIALNSLMVFYLATKFYSVNILSIFYISLALVIIMSSHFRVIWHASMAFCVIPSLLIITMFVTIHLCQFFKFAETQMLVTNLIKHMGFEFQTSKIEKNLHDQFLVMFANITYIICLMFVKRRSGGIKKQYTIIENLRSRRMIIIDADEDILFLFTSLCRFLLIIAKFYLIFLICKETLSFVNITNTLILISAFVYLTFTSEIIFSWFVKIILGVFLMKFFSRYTVIFGAFDDHIQLLYGFYFNNSFFSKCKSLTEIQSSQEKMFYLNFAMIYVLYLIKSLLSKTQSNTFLENKNFKTKYLSIVYNYFVDLLKHSKNVIDSTKIFFVYFVIFYFCINSSSSKMALIEFFYTNIILIYHMVLYKKQSNVKSWVFFALFGIYFSFLLCTFSLQYLKRFEFYSSVNFNNIKDLNLYVSQYDRNYKILYPYAIKILLTLISLNSIYTELQTQSFRTTPQGRIFTSSDVKGKIYYMILKIISVFLKEILLFYTCFKFLQKPNVFKLFYLLCYMHYFTSQIKSLSKIFERFKFIQIIQAKTLYYRNVILNPKFTSTFKNAEIDLYDPYFENLNIAYFRLMTKSIFNKIHQKVYTTWMWMFGMVILYMEFVFALAYLNIGQKDNLFFFFTFNLKDYDRENIISEFSQVTIVLFITVFEIYFIDILKSRRISSEKELIRSISSVILMRYQHIVIGTEADNQPLDSRVPTNMKTDDFIATWKDLKSVDLKEEDFEFSKLKTKIDPDEKISAVNLNHRISVLDKHVLLTHNRSKLSFLQVITGFLAFLKKLIILPLFVGILLRKNTPFALVLLALAYIFYSKKNYFELLNTINKALAIVCLVEYIFIFSFESSFSNINKALSSLEIRAMELREHPLSGLPFVFLYTAFIKAFYMLTILCSRFVIVEIDKVSSEIFNTIRSKTISGVNYVIMDYKHWGRDKYFVFYKIKKISLTTLADVFFISALISYYHMSGFMTYLPLLFLMTFKFIFSFYLKRPFGQSTTTKYEGYYRFMSYLNFLVLLCYQLPFDNMVLDITIDNKVLFALTIILNFIIIDCTLDPECQSEKTKAERYYWVKNQLGLFGLVYAQNEKNITEIVELEVKDQYLKAQYNRNDHISGKKSLNTKSQDYSHENLETISVFSYNRSYKAFLFSQLNFVKTTVLRLKLWLRRKLLETNSASSNLFSLFSNYLYKNQAFIKEPYNLDLLKINKGDHSEIELLINTIEASKIQTFKDYERTFVKDMRTRVREVDEPMLITRNRNSTIGIPVTTNAGVSKAAIANANIYLMKGLTIDRMALQLKELPENNFGENIYKYKITENEYLILRNFDQISIELNDLQMTDIGAKEYFKWVVFLIWVRFELIMNIVLISTLCFSQGFLSTVYIFILLFLILIENRMKNLKYWQLFYLVFMINLIIQLILNTRFHLVEYSEHLGTDPSNLPSEMIAGIGLFLYGKIDQDYQVIIFILIEITLMHLYDNFGWEKTLLEIESSAQAVLRVCLHKKSWQHTFNRASNINLSEIKIIEKNLKEKYKAKLNEKEYTIFLVNLIKRKSSIYKCYKEKFGVFVFHLERIFSNYKQDMNLIKPKFFKNYFWRNFAYPLRKSGRNYHAHQLLSLIVMMVYFMVYFFKMQGIDKNVIDIFRNNEIHSTLSINISIMLLVICFERYIHSRTALYWTYCTDNERDIGSRHIRLMSLGMNQLGVRYITPIERLKRAVRRCSMILKWRSSYKINYQQSYKHNPLLLKFYLSVIMWFYISILAIVWIPMVSNQQIATNTSKKIFCNEIYRTEENPTNPANICNNFSSNIYLQILFLFGNIYLIIAIAQIRRGSSRFFYYKTQNYQKLKEVLKFYAYKYTPYIRELKTIVDYTAAQTSLNLFQWFKLEDIETTILTARNNEASNKYTGQRMDKIIKRVVGLSFLAFFFLLLVAPLYMFSDMLPNNIIDEVRTAKISLKVEVTSGSYLLYKNSGYTIEKLPRYNRLIEIVKQDERLKKFDNDLFRKLTFGHSSESYLDITYETANHISDEYKNSRLLKIIISLDMETSYRGALSAEFGFDLDEENATIFLAMISSSSCSDMIKNRIILGHSRKLLDLKVLFQKNKIANNQQNNINLENIYILSFNCEKDSNKVSFDLSDEDSDKIEFLVLSENINNSVDLLQRITSSNVSILSIYAIIFSYIGLTIIRKAFFDQAHIIWTTEMPNSQKLQDHIYMINYARQQGDLYSEAIFFNKLIDLYRAPEKIKKLTGPLFQARTFGNQRISNIK